MQIIDKRGILSQIENISPVILDLGCGKHKMWKQAIGVDRMDYDEVDIVGDVYDVLRAIPNEVVDTVYSSHFFEHVTDLGQYMEELGRIVKKGGQLHIVVPHFSNPYFYSDYTHKISFGLYSFSYFAQDHLLKRKVPTYGREIKFTLQDIHLIFKSDRAFYFRYGLKWMFGKLINASTYLKEFYEENMCYLFPCYEIKYTIKKIKS
jgi:predicted SAM-dependent methyltransferase